MNIFVLDTDPKHAAEYHADKHVVKMVLESAQLLSTAIGQGYKPTHKNHPCTLWTARSQDNAEWVYELACYLNEEYKKRYKHTTNHKSWDVIRRYHNAKSRRMLPSIGLTPFVLAMPEEYKTDDPVESYRAYYKSKEFARWAYGAQPRWW